MKQYEWLFWPIKSRNVFAFFCAACTVYFWAGYEAGAYATSISQRVPEYAAKHTAINVVLIYSYIISC